LFDKNTEGWGSSEILRFTMKDDEGSYMAIHQDRFVLLKTAAGVSGAHLSRVRDKYDNQFIVSIQKVTNCADL